MAAPMRNLGGVDYINAAFASALFRRGRSAGWKIRD